MDLGAAVEADEQSLEVVQPGEGALDDPADAAEPRAVACVATRDLGPDPPLAQLAPLRPVVVGPVGGQALGPLARATDATADRGHRVEQRDRLG